MPQFLDCFIETEDDEDLDQLILILRNIILLPRGPKATFSDTQQQRTKHLLTRFLFLRWNRAHNVNDVEESVLLLRQLQDANPSDKVVEEELWYARDVRSKVRACNYVSDFG